MSLVEEELLRRIRECNNIADSPGASNMTRAKYRARALALSEFLGWYRQHGARYED